MVDRPGDEGLAPGVGRGFALTLGLGLLLVGAYLLSATVSAGPLSGLVAGVVASLLGIELVTFGVRGRRFP